MSGLDAVYSERKAALLATIDAAGPDVWTQGVPAAPGWDVADVVRHVTGIASDCAAGSLPADLNLLEQFRDADVVAARDDFADGHVLRRRGRAPHDVVAEWHGHEPDVLERLRRGTGDPEGVPFGFDAVLVTDLTVHADDVAGALGRPPGRDVPAVAIAFAAYAFGVDYRLRTLGLPALALRFGERERVLGDGEPAATLGADRWELLRVLAGRRSRRQIAALDWTGDPEPYLELLPAYGERADDLIEG